MSMGIVLPVVVLSVMLTVADVCDALKIFMMSMKMTQRFVKQNQHNGSLKFKLHRQMSLWDWFYKIIDVILYNHW